MSTPDYRELPARIDLDETVEEVETTPVALDEGLPEPDKGWFASGG